MRQVCSFLWIAFAVFLCLNTGCKKKEDEDEKAEFDRKAMLENIGSNIILPNYEILNTAVEKLDSAIIDFTANPDVTRLGNVQDLFKDAYRAWQACSMFEFGPADEVLLRVNLNTFPTTVSTIQSNISSGSYNLSSVSNFSAKGFPAIDYLLFGIGADNNAILTEYTSATGAANRKQYLKDISAEIKNKVSTVYNDWLPSDGNYYSTFINSTGTSSGSSTALLVNQMNQDFEITKNYRFGVPLGKNSGGTLYPEKVEAYYSGISKELALLHVEAIENLFLGKSSIGDGSGFDDYLENVEAEYNGGALKDVIKSQFTLVKNKISTLTDPLSQEVQSNSASANAAYSELQQLVVLLKTDMSSALSILISYVDNDGD